MLMPGERVKLDKPGHHWLVQVDVMRRVRVRVTLEHLHTPDVFVPQVYNNNVKR